MRKSKDPFGLRNLLQARATKGPSGRAMLEAARQERAADLAKKILAMCGEDEQLIGRELGRIKNFKMRARVREEIKIAQCPVFKGWEEPAPQPA